jgi:hypothetical protein
VREWVIQNTDLKFFHFANERQCSAQYGSLLKRMGVTAGVSDIFLPKGNDTFKGLWIELKVGKNKATPAQLDFINDMIAEGYSACVAYGAEEAILMIRQFYGL